MEKYNLTYNKDIMKHQTDVKLGNIDEIYNNLHQAGYELGDMEVEAVVINGGKFMNDLSNTWEFEITSENVEEEIEEEFIVINNKVSGQIEARSKIEVETDGFDHDLIKGGFVTLVEAVDFANDYRSKYDITKTPFNDAETFVKEFSGYLIGKKIEYIDSQNDADSGKHEILNVYESKELDITSGDDSKPVVLKIRLIDYDIHNKPHFGKPFLINLYLEGENGNDLQKFIDGETISPEYADFNLILQEETIEKEKINQPDYKYYVVLMSHEIDWKIQTGWEFKEDADDNMKEQHQFGNKDTSVLSKRTLMQNNVNPDDNSNWQTDSHDWAIIEESFDTPSFTNFNTPELNKEQIKKYIDGFKNGKFISVIKANLIYYLDNCQRALKNSLAYSDIDNGKRYNEKIERIVKELMRVIQMEQ